MESNSTNYFASWQWMTVGDVSRRIGLTEERVRQLIRQKKIRATKLGGWMVRPEDGVDCGVWTRVRPDRLVIPLDTHIARISSYIGLTDMKSPGWAMALDITKALRRLDGADPLKYDFALCHLGIAGSSSPSQATRS